MTAPARVPTSEGMRDVADLDLPELRDEMDELIAELTGLVVTPRSPENPPEILSIPRQGAAPGFGWGSVRVRLRIAEMRGQAGLLCIRGTAVTNEMLGSVRGDHRAESGEGPHHHETS